MQDTNARPITIILDALDKCAELETQDLIQYIKI
jgi:hypothetical protein